MVNPMYPYYLRGLIGVLAMIESEVRVNPVTTPETLDSLDHWLDRLGRARQRLRAAEEGERPTR